MMWLCYASQLKGPSVNTSRIKTKAYDSESDDDFSSKNKKSEKKKIKSRDGKPSSDNETLPNPEEGMWNKCI